MTDNSASATKGTGSQGWQHKLEASWYRPLGWRRLFWPVQAVLAILVTLRRKLFEWRWLSSYRSSLPVIVVGNITVGGAGKTPTVIWLVQWLQSHGYHPTILSRGYGGDSRSYPLLVDTDVTASQCGDEPRLLATRLTSPVVVDPKRSHAAQWVETHLPEVDVLITDDGLQHYALDRDFELVVMDARRGVGNGWLMPFGPLREPKRRASKADLLVINGEGNSDTQALSHPHTASLTLQPNQLVNLSTGERIPVDSFPRGKVHAVAGIGSPGRFFDTMRRLGFEVIEHAHADHYSFQPSDIKFSDELPVIMTEKDAQKCFDFNHQNAWYLEVDGVMTGAAEERLTAFLNELRRKPID